MNVLSNCSKSFLTLNFNLLLNISSDYFDFRCDLLTCQTQMGINNRFFDQVERKIDCTKFQFSKRAVSCVQ